MAEEKKMTPEQAVAFLDGLTAKCAGYTRQTAKACEDALQTFRDLIAEKKKKQPEGKRKEN